MRARVFVTAALLVGTLAGAVETIAANSGGGGP
jgi:hypothetical protein